ncbi:MAG: GspMb/PilO family protein [Silicimonas sp.]|nr:GspMb/PilO family protein [Silicimonas sp.]
MTWGLKLAFLCLLVAGIAGEAWSRYARAVDTRQEAIALAQAQTGKLQARYTALLAEQAALQSSGANEPMLWQAVDGGVPHMEIQTALADLTADTGTALKSLQVKDTQIAPLVSALRVTMEIEADLYQWQQLLARFHQNEPVILPLAAAVPDNLNISTKSTNTNAVTARATSISSRVIPRNRRISTHRFNPGKPVPPARVKDFDGHVPDGITVDRTTRQAQPVAPDPAPGLAAPFPRCQRPHRAIDCQP